MSEPRHQGGIPVTREEVPPRGSGRPPYSPTTVGVQGAATSSGLQDADADPLLIVGTRLGKALYAVCAVGVGGIVTGTFVARLTAQNIFSGLTVAILAGVL